MVLELPMRKVINLIELCAFHDGIQVPATNTWIRFDMKKKTGSPVEEEAKSLILR